MANPKDPTKQFVSNIWASWCSLEPQRRTEVASKLGAFGHMLSIAANVQQFANTVTESSNPQTQDSESKTSESSNEDEDVIDVEFQEVK